MSWTKKHLLDIESLTAEEITTVLDTARGFKAVGERAIKKVPALRGKTVVNLFVEPSTRTRISFELAAQRLSADIVNFSADASSFKKGETLKDTALNLQALNADFIIIRHSASGAPHFLSRVLNTQEVFVVFNTAATNQTLPARTVTYPAGTVLENLLNTNETIVVAAGSQTPPISVPGSMRPVSSIVTCACSGT